MKNKQVQDNEILPLFSCSFKAPVNEKILWELFNIKSGFSEKRFFFRYVVIKGKLNGNCLKVFSI